MRFTRRTYKRALRRYLYRALESAPAVWADWYWLPSPDDVNVRMIEKIRSRQRREGKE